LTVRSVTFKRLAISLLLAPTLSRSTICRSRGVTRSSRSSVLPGASRRRCSVSTVKSQSRHALERLRVLAPELASTFGREEAPR